MSNNTSDSLSYHYHTTNTTNTPDNNSTGSNTTNTATTPTATSNCNNNNRVPNYIKAQSYWQSISPTVNGMLGGFEVLTEPDARDSFNFIKEFIRQEDSRTEENVENNMSLKTNLACDCGAGIGRVSKSFLLKVFDKVDLVEQNTKFLETAENEYLSEYKSRIDHFIPVGLQDFVPEQERYDLIWCQWVLGHLTGEDLIDFFKRCIKGLKKPDGLIGVKENITRYDRDMDFDDEDSSVTRPDTMFKDIFEKAGLKLIKEAVQQDFPQGLYPVKMYMLKPTNS